MAIIQWLPHALGQMRECFRPKTEDTPVYEKQQIDGRTRMAFAFGLISWAMIGTNLPLTAQAADLSPATTVKPLMVVAAGVGYENAEASKLTVKTYDAENGAILSEETFDLDVREDTASADNEPRERVFAGGVGPGADGLSAFTLRAYDAATGRYLWEGLLNLSAVNQESGSTHQVMTHLVAPRATVTQVRNRGAIDGQPYFFLRAVDSATGELSWADQFSAGAGTFVRTERVSRAVVEQTEGLAVSPQQIEFRIRMMDDQGRRILWEDTIERVAEEVDMAARHDAAAETLPVWRGTGSDEMKREAI